MKTIALSKFLGNWNAWKVWTCSSSPSLSSFNSKSLRYMTSQLNLPSICFVSMIYLKRYFTILPRQKVSCWLWLTLQFPMRWEIRWTLSSISARSCSHYNTNVTRYLMIWKITLTSISSWILKISLKSMCNQYKHKKHHLRCYLWMWKTSLVLLRSRQASLQRIPNHSI